MPAVVADADDEQAGSIGAPDELPSFDHQAIASVDRDPVEPGFRRSHHGLGADHGKIDPSLLLRLLELDQNSASTFAAQLATTSQQAIGTFDRLDAEDQAVLDNDRLSNVKLAQSRRDLDSKHNVSLCLRIRRFHGHCPGACQKSV